MKINTRKLLLFLYKEDESEQNIITYDHLFYLWKELSAGGMRSLIHHLQGQKLIQGVTVKGERGFQITQIGKQVIAFHYRLQDTANLDKEKQQLLILLSPPSSDPQFRFLLSRVKISGLMIKKGVYLLPLVTPDLTSLCKEKYYNSVLLTTIEQWRIGDPSLLGQTDLFLQSITDSLSGISTELNQVIGESNPYSLLNHQQKIVIFSAFDRLLLIFDQMISSPFVPLSLFTSGKIVLESLQQRVFI
jgi:hypothetical protein